MYLLRLREQIADRAAVVRFLLFIIVLVCSIVRTSLVTLPCLICFLYSMATISDDNNKNSAEPMIVASVLPIP